MDIFDAIKTNDIKRVEKILKNKSFNINKANKFGNTPLHDACYDDNLEIVALLLASGAQKSIYIAKDTFWSPLLWACYNNNLEIVKLLLNDAYLQLGESGTKEYINRTDKDCLNVLSWACENNNLEIVKLLLKYGAHESINKSDKYDATPFLISCNKNNLEMAKLLLDRGAHKSINKADSDGCTPLYFACWRNNLDMVKLLLNRGAQESISKVNNYFMTPLFWTCKNDNPEIVELLLVNGADIDQKSFFNAEDKPKILQLLTVAQNYDTTTEKNKQEFISKNNEYYEMLAKRALTKYLNETNKNKK
jgi:ankyrin repeat protein